MAANQTKPNALSVESYVAAIKDERRRADAAVLVELMQKISGKKPVMWGSSIVGFGSYHYTYESGREGDMPVVGFAVRSTAMVLYGLRSFDESGALPAKLGVYTTGKGCLYVKKLADVDLGVLEQMLGNTVAGRSESG